jgi:tetratricopeptide (TPR) repeat protein
VTRGLINGGLRRYTEAVEDYGRALDLKRDANTLSYRGWAYLKLDAFRPALADFEAALHLDAAHTDALCGRALARVRLNQVVDGLKDAEASLSPGRPTARVLLNAARVYARAVSQLESRSDGGRALANTAYQYQERALALLRAAVEEIPPSRRKDFWRRDVQNEAAFLPIRQCTEMLQLARVVAR